MSIINSLLIEETITTNAKLISNHFNTVFTSIAAKVNENIILWKLKSYFHIIFARLPMKLIFLSQTTPASQGKPSLTLYIYISLKKDIIA